MRHVTLALLALLGACCHCGLASAELRAGAAVVDITPAELPVLVNGGMVSRSIDEITTKIHARALVLDDGASRIGIVVVDSCMMPRPLLDEAKQLAAQRTKLAPDHILISATHAHSAPSCMGALGTAADPKYVPLLRIKLAEALERAEENLEPAEVGWAVAQAPEYTALRRWVRRPDRVVNDPFGNPTVRANMHAGRNWDDVTGESGPEDPSLSIISVRTAGGRPLALLANFSMHYFGGVKGIGADYFGRYCQRLAEQVQPQSADSESPFVGIMSHGCSGDIWRRDYTLPAGESPDPSMEEFADGLAQLTLDAYRGIRHTRQGDLKMAETRMTLNYRVPDLQRLEWAQRIVDQLEGQLPKTQQEVYAVEQVLLAERKSTEIVVQALRIGDIGIATTPNETYALSGLKVKRQSPLPQTMVIELANGGDGYIPPPEQHVLGGYNTWAARSAGLEVNAEPKIVEAAVQLLERVTGKPRRTMALKPGPGTRATLELKPAAYWRLDEMAGPHATDASPNGRDGVFEPAIAYYLAGPASDRYTDDDVNRAAHFAGSRLRARLPELGEQYSVSIWVWNGMPSDARETAGWFFSRDHDFGLSPGGEHLGIGGTATQPGRLVFLAGERAPLVGATELKRWTWHHVVLVRDGKSVKVYLDGRAELEGTAGTAGAIAEVFLGGRSDRQDNWEGRLDEAALFSRALTAEEVARLK
ncbi:MAG: hypothetical protein KDB14_26385 [Planctomycetales bacterium]|nr:hypothetical protein [Planctomycetales bacterium]